MTFENYTKEKFLEAVSEVIKNKINISASRRFDEILNDDITTPELKVRVSREEYAQAYLNSKAAEMVETPRKEHTLKIQLEHAFNFLIGIKNWEIRKNDRDFQEGDIIHFQVILPDETISDEIEYSAKINYIFKGGEHGLEDGYVILSISKI